MSLNWSPAMAVSWKIAPSSASSWVSKSFSPSWKLHEVPFEHFSAHLRFAICRPCKNWFPNSFMTFRLENPISKVCSHLAWLGVNVRIQTIQQSRQRGSWGILSLASNAVKKSVHKCSDFLLNLQLMCTLEYSTSIPQRALSRCFFHLNDCPTSVTQVTAGVSGLGTVWSFPTVGAISTHTQQHAYSYISKGLYWAAVSDHFQVQNPCCLHWVAVLISAKGSSLCVF